MMTCMVGDVLSPTVFICDSHKTTHVTLEELLIL